MNTKHPESGMKTITMIAFAFLIAFGLVLTIQMIE